MPRVGFRCAGVLLGLSAALLAGCGVAPRNAPDAATHSSQGTIHGGQQPVAGASVQLYAVGTTGDGSAATPLLSPAQTTNASGEFNLLGLFTCPSPTALVYLVGTGGNPGLGAGGSNPSLALMTVIGECQSITSSTFLSVNELTTVAAAYALQPYFKSPSAIGAGTTDAAALTTAFSYAQELVNPATGTTPGTGVPTGLYVPTTQINTIADIVAGCINSSGALNANGEISLSTSCGKFFTDVVDYGVAPFDTITALVDLAISYTINTSQLYALAVATAPYQPIDSVQPEDFSISLYENGTLQLTPTAGLDFPLSAIGSTSQLTAVLTNTGPAAVTLSSIFLQIPSPLAFSQTNNCPSTLAASASCNISVTFAPTATGNPSGQLLVYSDAVDSHLAIPVNGTAAYPVISVSPTSLSFPSTTVNVPSTPQTLTVTNQGAVPLSVGTISFSGTNAADFSQTSNCSTPVAPGAYCTISVTMTPQGNGPRFASLSIPSNAATGTVAVQLAGSGSGAAPGPLVPSTLSLYVPAPGPAGLTHGYFDLTNNSSAAISVSSISISPSTYFTQTNTCGTSLAPGASCLVTASYLGTANVFDTASLIVANSSSSPQVTVTLYGSASPLTYTTTALGSSTSASAAAQYTGDTYELLGGITGVNESDFSFPGASYCYSSYSYYGGTWDICSVQVLFTPAALGSRVAVLNNDLPGGATPVYLLAGFGAPPGSLGTISASPTSLTFAQTAIGVADPVQTVTIANPQGHLLNFIASVNQDYSISPAYCSATSCTLSVTFQPLSVSSYTSPLTVTIFDSVTNLTTSVTAEGYGGIPTLAFSPATLNFGNVIVGSSSSATFQVSDTGDSPAYLYFGPPAGANAADFSGYSFDATVTAGTPYTFAYPYTFKPTGMGVRTASITITDSRSGLVLGTYTLTGTGTGALVATLGASPTSLTFGNTILGTPSATQTIAITNSGNGPATISSITMAGANPSDFTDTTTCGSTLNVNASCNVVVTFTPGSTGSRAATLVVNSNDPSSPLTVPLAGTGMPVPVVTLSPSSLMFYERGVPQTVTLTNLMNTPLSISSLNFGGANFTQTNNCGTTLAANSSCAIQVSAGPTPGIFTDTLTLIDSDTVDTQTVALSSSVQYSAIYNFGSSAVGVVGQTDSFEGGIVTGTGGGYTFVTYTLTESGPNNADFPPVSGETNSCSDKQGISCYVYFEFLPSAPGVRYAIVSGNDGSNYLFKGTGVTPTKSYSISPSTPQNFGTVAVGSSSSIVVYVSDTSNPLATTYLSIHPVTLSTGGTNNGDFSLVNGCSTLGGSTYYCYITVTFKPQTAGPHSTVLTIPESSGSGFTQTLQFSGTGH